MAFSNFKISYSCGNEQTSYPKSTCMGEAIEKYMQHIISMYCRKLKTSQTITYCLGPNIGLQFHGKKEITNSKEWMVLQEEGSVLFSQVFNKNMGLGYTFCMSHIFYNKNLGPCLHKLVTISP